MARRQRRYHGPENLYRRGMFKVSILAFRNPTRYQDSKIEIIIELTRRLAKK